MLFASDFSRIIFFLKSQIHTKAKYLGSALYELGYRREDLIGICAQNKPQVIKINHVFHVQFVKQFPKCVGI